MFRFIHTADLHLDSPLKAMRKRNADIADSVGIATRAAFERIVGKAIEERVDALLISGDLYDGTTKDIRTGIFLADCVRRLSQADVHTVIILGNHDAQSVVKPPFPTTDLLTVFAAKPDTIRFEAAEVAIHGASFRDRQVPDDMTDRYPAPIEGWTNIGMLHTSLGGFSGHDSYAPTTPDRLADRGYDYWALGHVHKHQIVAEQGAGRPWIIYPGIPQGRDMGETGMGRAILATVTGPNRIEIEAFEVSPILLERVSVDLSDARSFSDIEEAVPSMAVAIVDAGPHAHAIIRLVLSIPARLIPIVQNRQDTLWELLQTNVQGRGPGVAVEKIDCVPTEGDTSPGPALDAGTLKELLALVEADAAADSDLMAGLKKDFDGLFSKLPRDLRDDERIRTPVTGETDAGLAAWLDSVTVEAAVALGGGTAELTERDM